MTTMLNDLNLAFFGFSELLRILLVIAFIFLLNQLVGWGLKKLSAMANQTNSHWDNTIVDAARAPLRALVWVLGASFMFTIIQYRLSEQLIQLHAPWRYVGVIFCIAWFLFRLVALASDHFVQLCQQRGEEIDYTTVDALSKLGRLIIVVLSSLVILQTLGFSISGVLAAGGIGGLAIGFAAKDLLANFFGGLTIYMDRPFSVGEWIRSPDRQIEGTVEKISWRHTRIRGFNKNPIYVPNAVFTTIVVENPSRMTHRRVNETIGIRYDDLAHVASIVAAIKNMLFNHPGIDNQETIIVNFNGFAASSLDLYVYAFTKTTNWVVFHEVKQSLLLEIAAIIEQHGAQIAFPTQTLHVETFAEHP